ncbi:MAG: cysteine--tRNA ligase [Armatimonadota bacterium]|nr:cysteine--tRNA ligase [bacterium]MDW8321871.1 cysteine--tRNA ligase [Armatimonadota bacterium]
MLPLRIYNSLTRREEEFVPRDPGKVSIYACGLTVQGPPHVGHLRGAILFDAIRRWLMHLGYEVHMVQNFTDIDDKIIAAAAKEGITPAEVAEKYARKYVEVMERLGILPVHYCRVTENIDEIIGMIQRLIEKGHAYVVDGDVYYDVSSFPEYGKLSGRNLDEVRAGYRIEVDERKDDPADFALWKAAKPGEPYWESPWGNGRPGWHIECSAMSLKYLGAGFDIHAGGNDLVFPHHENEIAQSEAYLDGVFARYWMHWGSVNLRQEKMSKSVGNFFTAEEILAEFEPDVLRLFLLSTAYRSPIEFSRERMQETQSALRRIRTALRNVRRVLSSEDGDAPVAESYYERFANAMNSDFNTAAAISVLFDAVSEMNRLTTDLQIRDDAEARANLASLVATVQLFGNLLGIQQLQEEERGLDDAFALQLIEKAIAWRQLAREKREWTIADRIRDDLRELGIILEDSVTGTTWRRSS